MKSINLKTNEQKVIPVIWTGKETLMDYSITLTGAGADVTLLMLLLGTDTLSLNLRTSVYHQAPHTKSRVLVKGALTDSSRVDFEGLVRIDKGATNSDTWLAAHLLLLSEDSSGRAVPNLEISENEVKAGHASTVGRINEAELFYLMSRGLTQKAATRIVVEGFLNSLLMKFPFKVAQNARKEIKWF